MSLRPTFRPALAGTAALAAALGGLGACAPAAPKPIEPFRAFARDTLVIDAPATGAYVGSTVAMHAVFWKAGLDSAANRAWNDSVGAPAVSWETNGIRQGWITEDGVLTLAGSGTLVLRARGGKVMTERRIEVRGNPVTSVAFRAPTDTAVTVGDTARLAALVRAGGEPVTDVQVHYGVGIRGRQAAGASMSAAGDFVAARPGVYTVVAECNGHADVRTIVARPREAMAAAEGPALRRLEIARDDRGTFAGTALPFQARAWADGDQPLADARPRWSTSDSTVAVVGPDGMVGFRRSGRVTITARLGGQEARESFGVYGNPAARIVLSTRSDGDVRVGDQVRLHEDVWQMGGQFVHNIRANYIVVAQSGAADAVTLDDDRTFVARVPGVYTIVAQAGRVGDAQVLVVRPRVGSDLMVDGRHR